MIVDIGGGTSDIAVISLGGSVVSTSIKIAGDDFDEALVRYMRKKHNLLIGERTAEDIKIKIGTCYPLAEAETMDVRGRNLVTGLPRTITVSSEETEEALRESTLQIVEAVHAVLEKTPPELAADAADRGRCRKESISVSGDGCVWRQRNRGSSHRGYCRRTAGDHGSGHELPCHGTEYRECGDRPYRGADAGGRIYRTPRQIYPDSQE